MIVAIQYLLRTIRLLSIASFLLLSCQTALAASPQHGTPAIELQSVKHFITKMVKTYHFNRHELDHLFAQVIIYPPLPRKKGATPIIPLEKRPWYIYKKRYITSARVANGVQFWQQHAVILADAEKQYHVPASIIVAIIGIESNYGENSGKYSVLHTLTTLAFSKNRRAAYFRKELTQYLLLCREEHLEPLTTKGSYAGAIGQPQFMPSSYRYYAIDFSGDHQRDLINNEADVIGSIANYFHKNGWKNRQPVAVRAILKVTPHHSKQRLPSEQFKPSYTQQKIRTYGLRPLQPLPPHAKVRFIQLEQPSYTEYWLGLHNFYVITRYNYSTKYAMAVYQLSEAIAEQHHLLNRAIQNRSGAV